MTTPLVVLTYPGHFLLTAVTIKSYLQHHQTPSKILVIVDDLSYLTWPGYVDDCQTFYQQFRAQIVATSNNSILKNFIHNGWVRQQVIKLHLDLLHDFDSWFFSDGDIVFLNTVEPDTVPYSLPEFSEITRQQNLYVSQMLKLDRPGIILNNRQVCVSNPAFRTMNAKTLQDLRSTIEINLQNTFYKIQEPFQHMDSISVSEWELIENFKCHVLGKKLHLVQYAPHDYVAINSKLDFFKHQFITCYRTDSAIGRTWFESQGIDVLDRYWHRVEKIHK